jgi:nucleotide sugar dehydrogenase
MKLSFLGTAYYYTSLNRKVEHHNTLTAGENTHMPSQLTTKSEKIDTPEEHGKHTVSIIGCGQSGILHAYLLAEAGFKVICADADQTVVNMLSKGKAPLLKREMEAKLRNHVRTGFLTATNDTKTAVSQSNIIVVTVPVKVDDKRKVDYSKIESACKQVGSGLQQGSLVIVASIVGFGATEGVIRETLENTSGLKAGTDFDLAYSPAGVLNTRTGGLISNQERIVAGIDGKSLKAASAILETATKNKVKKAQSIKTAELTALFEIVQQDVDIAVANELAILCEKAGVDYLDLSGLLDAREDSTPPLPVLTSNDIQREPYLLLENTEDLGLKLRMLTVAREINEETAKHAVNLAKDALRNCGKTLRRARVSLLGISQTQNAKGAPKKILKDLAKLLETKGAKVGLYDPYYSDSELAEIRGAFKKTLSDALDKADCAIILSGHEQFKRLNLKKLKALMKMPAAIVDLEGIIEADKVEKEGFIYRGLGRGVWTK